MPGRHLQSQLMCADDIVFLDSREEDLQNNINVWNDELKKINDRKSEHTLGKSRLIFLSIIPFCEDFCEKFSYNILFFKNFKFIFDLFVGKICNGKYFIYNI